jgi:hypothetical protein
MLRSTRPPKCRVCKERTSSAGVLLHDECVGEWVRIVREKKARAMDKKLAEARRNERKRDRERRRVLETIPELIAAADRAFMEWVRWRDRMAGMPCISSGKPLDWSGNQVDAGHYRSRGAASHLRYDPRNCHAQSKYENRHRAGNAVEYRIRLIERIGLAEVEALEADNKPHHWTKEELREIAALYRAKVRALKKETA